MIIASKLELHNVVKSCVNRRDYARIYSNKVLPVGMQKVKLYGIGLKQPNEKAIKKLLEACGFTHVSLSVRHSARHSTSVGRTLRSLVIYAKLGPTFSPRSAESFFPSSFFVDQPTKAELAEQTQESAFKAQRPLPKKEVMKLKPGTWIEVKWLDDANTAMLLLEKPENHSGDVSLRCYDPCAPATSRVHSHVVHSQVVRALGTVVVPTL